MIKTPEPREAQRTRANTRRGCRYGPAWRQQQQQQQPQDVKPEAQLKEVKRSHLGEALTVVHQFRELDPQSLFDPTHLFVHGEGFDV